MSEEKTNCKQCGREIRILTAERRDGLCAPCHRQAKKAPEIVFAEQVFERIESVVGARSNPRTARDRLSALPLGYLLCFAYSQVQSEIDNGGISQLYSNSTWALIVDAERAAREADVASVSNLLREIIYYYHLKGRSKLKRSLQEGFFDSIPNDWNRSLSELEDEYFSLEEVNSVILILCRDHQALFAEDN